MENLKKSLDFEIEFALERLADFRALAFNDPDDMLAVKMMYFYEGQLEAFNRMSNFVNEV